MGTKGHVPQPRRDVIRIDGEEKEAVVFYKNQRERSRHSRRENQYP